MIDSLITRIAGLWTKDFLFASFLPSLIFFPVVGITAVVVLGWAAMWAWIDALTTSQRVAYTASAGLTIVVFAYCLSALRANFRWFWSGASAFPPLLSSAIRVVLEQRQRKRFRKMLFRTVPTTPWLAVLASFESDIAPKYAGGRPNISAVELQRLLTTVQGLRREAGQDEVKRRLQPVVEAYTQYAGESLKQVFYATKRTLEEWNDLDTTALQTGNTELDRQFGRFATIRATRLGNVIEAYNQYCYKRYRIEPELFWPRLRGAIRQENKYLELVDEPVILLDFSLTMASLCTAYAVLVITIGPWLRYYPAVWIGLCACALLCAWLFYEVAVNAAVQSGELIRATFDLFRLQMMGALGVPHPPDLETERNQWVEISSLAAYGEVASSSNYKLERAP